ncbi:MAG: efflux system, outer rane lipoprotein NodT family [Massilia sp.]|nr:efflux system, outer rane lipoprotein NodT family [Massilia sp.]
MNIRHPSRLALLLSALLLATGCTVGPNFKPPRPTVPAAYLNPSAPPTTQTSVTLQQPTDVAQWWKTFNDPSLDSLVTRAVESNLDLRLATSRLRQARAARGVVASALWPDINANGSYSHFGTGRKNSTSSDLYQAGFDAAWEIDVFGGVRRSVEASDASIEAAVEDRRDVLVTLAAEVAVDYIDLRGFQRQIAIANENLAAQRRTADLTRRRFNAGFVSRLDAANADAQVASTESDIPALESSARQAIYSLSLLLGREPEALLAELSQERPIPLTPPEVPIGLPSDLLRRRPDIRRAEAQLHAATAQIGVATADLFPKFSLTGNFNLESSKLKSLGNWSSALWSMGPSVTWPLFTAGRIQANIEVQNAVQEQALIAYDQAVLGALRDVEAALIAYSKEQQRRLALVNAVTANREAFDLSTRLYTQGQTDFLNVLTAERSLFGAETALTASDTTIATDLAALYKALGGGWEAGGALGPATAPAPTP